MATGTYNISARQGTRFRFRFNIATNGTGIDLTGYSAAMQVRKTVNSSTTLLNLVSPTNITLNASSVNGDVLVVVSGSSMAALPAGTWVYDFELTDGDGNPEAILEGKFIVKAEVTR